MHVLAFDTATAASCVALLLDERTLGEDRGPARARHGETLLPRVRSLLESCGLELSAVDLIAVGHGPGSFTGLRVGLATAKGLAIASGLPVRAVSTLQVLAAPASSEGVAVAPLLDAHKGEVFAALYRHGDAGPEAILPPFAASPREAAERIAVAWQGPVHVLGDGLRRHGQAVLSALGERARPRPEADDVPSASALGRLALRAFRVHGADDLAALEPLYVRGSDAKLPDTPLER